MSTKNNLLNIIKSKASGEIICNDGNLKFKLNFEYIIYWEEDKENEIPETWSAVGWKVEPYSRNFVEFTPNMVARIIKRSDDYFVIVINQLA